MELITVYCKKYRQRKYLWGKCSDF